MSLQVVIIAHGNGIAAFKRHEKFWLMHDVPLLVCCPENDPVETTHEKLVIGKAEHGGAQAALRLQGLMVELNRRQWNRCIIYEYDSFLLAPKLPQHRGFYGICFGNAESPKYSAPIYANPPWYFDRDSFEAMKAKSEAYPGFVEGGYADRYFSGLAYLAGVPVSDFEPPGYSRGLIQAEHLTEVENAIKQHHCYAFHGIKQEWVLRAIEQFWDEKPWK